jgi:hypothetical protein
MPKLATFRVLCAMAHAEITAAPTLDDGEWIERVKTRLARQHFTCSPPHELIAAIRAVERARTKSGQSRPSPEPPTRIGAPEPERTSTLPHNVAVAILAKLGASVPQIPRAHLDTVGDVRKAEHRKALKLVAEAIRDQVQRCEDAEKEPE